MTKLYQIYYDDKSKENCHEEMFPFFNKKGKYSVYYENEAIIDIVRSENDCDYLGIFSHKCFQKSPMRRFSPEKLRGLNEKDAYSFFPRLHPARNFKIMGGTWKPDYQRIMAEIIKKLGFRFRELTEITYQNAFITRLEIYRDYVENFLIPGIDIIEGMKEGIYKEVHEPVQYRGKGNSYTVKPFLCEFFFAFYCMYNGIKIEHV